MGRVKKCFVCRCCPKEAQTPGERAIIEATKRRWAAFREAQAQ
jgi:hypothetical protein